MLTNGAEFVSPIRSITHLPTANEPKNTRPELVDAEQLLGLALRYVQEIGQFADITWIELQNTKMSKSKVPNDLVSIRALSKLPPFKGHAVHCVVHCDRAHPEGELVVDLNRSEPGGRDDLPISKVALKNEILGMLKDQQNRLRGRHNSEGPRR